MTAGPTLNDVRAWSATVGMEQGSGAFGFSRSWGYELHGAGEFPCKTITIRGRVRIVTASLIRVLEGGEP